MDEFRPFFGSLVPQLHSDFNERCFLGIKFSESKATGICIVITEIDSGTDFSPCYNQCNNSRFVPSRWLLLHRNLTGILLKSL